VNRPILDARFTRNSQWTSPHGLRIAMVRPQLLYINSDRRPASLRSPGAKRRGVSKGAGRAPLRQCRNQVEAARHQGLLLGPAPSFQSRLCLRGFSPCRELLTPCESDGEPRPREAGAEPRAVFRQPSPQIIRLSHIIAAVPAFQHVSKERLSHARPRSLRGRPRPSRRAPAEPSSGTRFLSQMAATS
jgi:hypothetical protein